MRQTAFSEKETEAIRSIRNYLMHKGEMPSVRELMAALNYKSPRSAALIIESLIKKKVLKRRSDGMLQLIKDPAPDSIHAKTVDIPLVGNVACGIPILAEENIEGMISVSVNLVRPGFKYFLLRAVGDSMDKAGINDGDLALIRQQPMAEEGQTVVALIDDGATIKRIRFLKDHIMLEPVSKNAKNRPIILERDFQVQGVVVAVLPKIVRKIGG